MLRFFKTDLGKLGTCVAVTVGLSTLDAHYKEKRLQALEQKYEAEGYQTQRTRVCNKGGSVYYDTVEKVEPSSTPSPR